MPFSSTYVDPCFHLTYDRSRPQCHQDHTSVFQSFYQYSPLSFSNLSFLLLFTPTVVSISLAVSLPLLPPFLCFPTLHTCSGTQPCASQPGQGGEQTAPVFSDNHHIACMPAPLLSLFFRLSSVPRLPAYLSQAYNRPPPHLPLAASAVPYISRLTGSLSTHNALVSFFSPFVIGFINCSCQWQNRHLGSRKSSLREARTNK